MVAEKEHLILHILSFDIHDLYGSPGFNTVHRISFMLKTALEEFDQRPSNH